MTSSPMYLRIADDLRQRMTSGDLPPGADLPSTAELERQYGVSQNTVRAAVALLRNEGRVDVPGPGRPSRVRETMPRIVRDASRRLRIEKDLALRGGLPAGTHLARDMGLPDEDAVVTLLGRDTVSAAGEVGWILGLDEADRIHQYTFLVGVAVIGEHGADECRIAHHYYAADLDQRVADAQPGNAVAPDSAIWPGGTMHQLALQGIEPARVRERITTRMPLPDERALLGMPDGVPLMVIRKITYDATETAHEVVDILMPGDRAENVTDIPLEPWPPGWRDSLADDGSDPR